MKSVVISAKDSAISTIDIPAPIPGPNDVLISLQASALNHRDVWIGKGMYAKIQYPVIPGSDGSGIVLASQSKTVPVGTRVIINPNIAWGDNLEVQSSDYSILGMPSQGTMSELISVPADRVHPIPDHLTFEQAAALPLAGLTAYRAVFTKGLIGSGHNVLITGIGGGVALMALQFAMAAGANVYCTSGKQEKLDKAIALGASGGALYNQEEWPKQLQTIVPSGFDCIIDSAGGSHWNELTGLLKVGGRLVFYGATNGNVPNLSLQRLFWKQITICGSTMGSDAEFEMMLHFCKHHGIIPVIDSIFSIDEASTAFELMETGQQFGKIVLHHGKVDKDV
jgi:NADPH:quinone reductase-like Zn-dependent oxidoreductase